MTVYLSALAGAGAQFFTSGGVPLAGGKIYTYTAGTTTAATTYTSSTGLVANTNPIVLDSAGRPPSQIWLSSTTNYKFILTTSTDVVLWTQDNIPGVAGAAAFAALLGSGGSAYIGFILGGTGAVATNLQERERRFVFLTDFLDMTTYVPGTTDVTTALTNALARCAATGQALYIPGSTSYYKLTNEVTVTGSIKIYGDGYNSRLKQTTAEKNVFICGGDFIEFHGLNIEGTGAAVDPTDFTKCNGVYASSRKGIKVQNCYVHGFQSCGVQMRDSFECDISHNLIYANYWSYPSGATSSADILFYSGTAGGRSVIIGNFCLSNNSQGIYVNAQGYDSEMVIEANVCVTMTDSLSAEVAAVDLDRRHGIVAGYGGGSGRFTVNANVCRNTLVTGIYHTSNTTATHAVTISANVCSLNGLVAQGASDATLSGGISLNGGGAQSVTLFANTIYDFQGDVLDSVGGITFNGLTSGNLDIQILDNVIDTSTSVGILIKGDLGDLAIRGNKIKGCTSHDITVEPNSSAGQQLFIEDNTCVRTINASAQSIYVDPSGGVKRNYVRRNRIIGYNSATNATTNTAIYFRGAVPITVSDNYIENFYWGVYSENSMTGRQVDTYHIDRNDFKTCTKGIRFYGGDNTLLVIACDNTFTSVTTPFDANGGYDSILTGIRFSTGATTRVQVYGVTAGDYPNGVVAVSGGTLRAGQGTWVVGDIIWNTTPVAAASPGWVITTAGAPAANVASKMANLI